MIRTRVALILNLALACLAGSCAEPARIDGRSVADCVEDLGRAGDAQRLAALDTLAAFGTEADAAVPDIAACISPTRIGDAAVKTLAAVGTRAALAELARALVEAPITATAAGAAAAALAGPHLRQIAERLATEQPDRAADLLAHAAVWDACNDSGGTRRTVVTALMRAPRAPGRRTDAITAHAIRHPTDFEDPVQVLIDALSRQPVSDEVLQTLSASGDARALDAILARCEAPWPSHPEAWLDAAAAWDSADEERSLRTLTALGSALDADEVPVRLAAVAALRTLAARVPPLRGPVVAALARACLDARPAVEAAAREAWLGLPGGALAVAAATARDSDLDRARRAIHALGESTLPDSVILPALALVVDSGPAGLASSVARAAARRAAGRDLQIRVLLAVAPPDADAEILRGIGAWARDPNVSAPEIARAAAAAPDPRRAALLLQELADRLRHEPPDDVAAVTAPFEAVVADPEADPERRARLLRWLCEHAPDRAWLPITHGSSRIEARVCLVGASPLIDFGDTPPERAVLVLRNGRGSTRLANLGDRLVLHVGSDGSTEPSSESDEQALTGTIRLALVVPWRTDGMGTSVRPPELSVLRILLP